MLFKNDKRWEATEWQKYLPEFKLPVVFKLKQAGIKEFENGSKIPVFNDESFEKKAFLLVDNEQCTIVQGTQQIINNEPRYQDAIMNFDNGTWVANSPEEVFIGFFHPACEMPEANKEQFAALSPRRAVAPKFSIYDAKVISTKKANENKLIAKVVSKMYETTEKRLRAIYISDGYGEHEPNASLEDIQLYYEPLIRKDVDKYFEVFFNSETPEISSTVYEALKKGRLKYKKASGTFTIAGSTEPFHIVPEGLREVEMANKSLITMIEANPDKTILVALRGE